MSQILLNQDINPAYAGLVDSYYKFVVDTHPALNVDETSRILLGQAVRFGSVDPDKLFPSIGANLAGKSPAIGFAVGGKNQQNVDGDLGYLRGDPVPVIKSGRIWTNTAKAIPANIFLRSQLGTGLLTDDPGALEFEYISVKSLTSTTSAGLILVEVKYV